MAVKLQFPVERCTPPQTCALGESCPAIPFPVVKENVAKAKTGKAKTQAANQGGTRKQLIAKVKIAQKQLGLDDAVYRLLLAENFGVSSCTELDDTGLIRLIGFFRMKGWQDRPANACKGVRDKHGKPDTMRDKSHPATPTLKRIGALLTELGKAKGKYMPWDYAAGILKKHTGLERLEQATVRELQNVMISLENTLKGMKRKHA